MKYYYAMFMMQVNNCRYYHGYNLLLNAT